MSFLNALKGDDHKYFWDGKRFWMGQDGRRYFHYNTTSIRLQLRCDGFRDWKAQAEFIKQHRAVAGAWPIALHAAGDVINVHGQKFLCTETILPIDDEQEGACSFISQILAEMLAAKAGEFVQWLAHAKAYTRRRSDIPPKIACLIGDCNSSKGLLANIANVALNGLWKPNKLGFLNASLVASEFENLEDIIWLLNMTDCRRDDGVTEKKFTKLVQQLDRGKRFGEIELTIRRILMVRCHGSYWPPIERIVMKRSPQGIIVFHAPSGFHLKDGDKAMNSDQVEERIRFEMGQFRHKLLTTPVPA